MCTILLLFQLVKDFPVVISENRDASLLKYVEMARVNPEALADRPPKVFYPPSARIPATSSKVPFVAPFDVTNVTWMGINQHRVVLALSTGYAPGEDARSEQVEKSRGYLAVEVLHSARSATTAKEYLKRALETGDYKSVNFLVADASSAWMVRYWGEEPEIIAPLSGKHIMGNYYYPRPLTGNEGSVTMTWYETDTTSRMNRASRILEDLPDFDNLPIAKVNALAGIRTLMTDHKNDPKHLMSICRHAPVGDVQTRRTLSNTTIFLHATELARSEIYYNPGNPCEHKWKSYSHLLQPECFEECYVEPPEPETEKTMNGAGPKSRKPLFGKFPLDK